MLDAVDAGRPRSVPALRQQPCDSLALAMDHCLDRAVAAQLPEKYSWLMAHGLIVTLVWLYLEILRLLARLRD